MYFIFTYVLLQYPTVFFCLIILLCILCRRGPLKLGMSKVTQVDFPPKELVSYTKETQTPTQTHHRDGKPHISLVHQCVCNGCMPVRAVCKPHSPDLKRGALATDARGCSLWRSLLERPPPAPESRVRDPLGELVRTRVVGVTLVP